MDVDPDSMDTAEEQRDDFEPLSCTHSSNHTEDILLKQAKTGPTDIPSIAPATLSFPPSKKGIKAPLQKRFWKVINRISQTRNNMLTSIASHWQRHFQHTKVDSHILITI